MGKSKRQVRVGMIGYKFMGKAHSHAYRDLPFYFDLDVEPVMSAICGRDERGVAAAAARYGWKSWETDWRRLIDDDGIDLIDIGTPNESHCEIALAAAEAGKHILCEKPLAMHAGQAKQMMEAAVKAGVVHMIGHNYRFAPAVQFAKALIDSGELGRIYHVRATYLQDWIMDPAFPLVWRLRKDVCGSGAHGDLLAHSIDLARFLVGEFKEVIGMMDTFIKQRPLGEMSGGLNAQAAESAVGEVDVDDAVACLARFANGAFGVFEATRFGKGNRNGNRIEINGSKGSIRWDMEHMNMLHLYTEDGSPGTAGFRAIHCTEPHHPYAGAYWPAGHSIGYEHTFVNLLHDLMQGIATGESPSPSFIDGYRNQLVLDAVERSAATGQWVAVPHNNLPPKEAKE